MTPNKAAKYLNKTYSGREIARLVGSTQPTIHKIINDVHTPQWPLGNALIVLARKCRRKAK